MELKEGDASQRICLPRPSCLLSILLVLLLSHNRVILESEAKSYGKCELALELANKHRVPKEDIPHWVCIAQYESTYDTKAVGHNAWDGSKDYGLFQINDRYWCSPPDDQNSCQMDCNDLIDDDIADDVWCARKIHRIHQRHEGNGFMAWVAWRSWCRGEDLRHFVDHCFSNDTSASTSLTNRNDLLSGSESQRVRPSASFDGQMKEALPANNNNQDLGDEAEEVSVDQKTSFVTQDLLPTSVGSVGTSTGSRFSFRLIPTFNNDRMSQFLPPPPPPPVMNLESFPLIFVPLPGHVQVASAALSGRGAPPAGREPARESSTSDATTSGRFETPAGSGSPTSERTTRNSFFGSYFSSAAQPPPPPPPPTAPPFLFFKARPLSWYRSLFSKPSSSISLADEKNRLF